MITRHTIIITLLLVLAQRGACHLKILQPESLILANEGQIEIEEVTSNFGFVPYGQQIIGEAIYPAEHDGCKPFNMTGFDSDVYFGNLILFVQRGTCSFATKVYNAELAGSSAVVIIDQDFEDDFNKTVISDDQNDIGQSVSIPSMMIKYAIGQEIVKQIQNGEMVSMIMRFDIPQSSHVEYQVWLSSDSKKSYEVINRFKQYHDILTNITVVPHYILWYNPTAKPTWQTPDANCLSGGRFCAPDPDGFGPLSGQDIVLEDLNQLCIYKISPEDWWIYLETFNQKCFNNDDQTTLDSTQCTQQSLEATDVTQKQLEDCIQESFYNKESYDKNMDDNSLLQKQRDAYKESGTPIWPAFVINGKKYLGNFDPQNLFEALCSAYDSYPQVCTSMAKEVRQHEYEEEEMDIVRNQSRKRLFIVVCIIIIVFLVFTYFFYKRKIKRQLKQEMQESVQKAVSKYYTFKTQQDEEEREEDIENGQIIELQQV